VLGRCPERRPVAPSELSGVSFDRAAGEVERSREAMEKVRRALVAVAGERGFSNNDVPVSDLLSNGLRGYLCRNDASNASAGYREGTRTVCLRENTAALVSSFFQARTSLTRLRDL